MAWQNVVDIDGDQHDYWKQEMGNGCGPSCVATIVRKQGRAPTERDIAEWISQSERVPSLTNLAGVGHDFTHQGTWNVQDALRKAGCLQAYTDRLGDFAKIFRERCTKSRPAIAWIAWDPDPLTGISFLHWVVILGPSRTNPNFFLVLDPFHGYSHQQFNQLPNYTAPNGDHAVFRSDNWNGVVTTK